jgi:hypothetical protein
MCVEKAGKADTDGTLKIAKDEPIRQSRFAWGSLLWLLMLA